MDKADSSFWDSETGGVDAGCEATTGTAEVGGDSGSGGSGWMGCMAELCWSGKSR